jgi:hypothetical protein
LDTNQFKLAAKYVQACASVEGSCGNLKNRLAAVKEEVKKELKSEEHRKTLVEATKTLDKAVGTALTEMKSALKLSDADVRAMTMEAFKTKCKKMETAIRATNDAGAAFFSALQAAKQTGWHPAGVALLACENYNKHLIEYGSAAKIAYNSLK